MGKHEKRRMNVFRRRRETNSVLSVASFRTSRLHWHRVFKSTRVGAAWIVVWMQHGTHNHIGILLGSVFSLAASASSLPPNTLSTTPFSDSRIPDRCATLHAHVNR